MSAVLGNWKSDKDPGCLTVFHTLRTFMLQPCPTKSNLAHLQQCHCSVSVPVFESLSSKEYFFKGKCVDERFCVANKDIY